MVTKILTVPYVHGLGLYLDTQHVPYVFNLNNTITFEYLNEMQLFAIGYGFGLFKEQTNQEEEQ